MYEKRLRTTRRARHDLRTSPALLLGSLLLLMPTAIAAQVDQSESMPSVQDGLDDDDLIQLLANDHIMADHLG